MFYNIDPCQVSDQEIVDRMRMWDGDGDGKINFAEFLVAMAQILTDTENEERMREAFRIFDKVIERNQSSKWLFS